MSTSRTARKGTTMRGRVAHPRDEVRLTRKNWILFGVALGVIALGFILLRSGSITLAPILLVAGYCFLIPWAIMARDGALAPPKV
ncbi:MAG: hypothetical protein SGI90_00645 [Candidatus Eisenbacteria bacterium]|nr:hypothetical protein [Candidatus Eisenbacteria bacterium]